MNILPIFLFIASLSTLIGETKAEEKVCSFSTPMQYAKCLKKKNFKIIPKYPLETYPKKIERNWSWLGNDSHNSLINKPNYTIIKFKTDDGKKLEVTKSVNKYTTWNGLDWRFKNPVSLYINGEDIISWKFNLIEQYSLLGIYEDVHNIEIKYIDNFGNKESLFMRSLQWRGRAEMVEFLLRNASGISKNEKRDINKLIENKLKKYEKKATIVSSIIKRDFDKNKGCLLVKYTKFPYLIKEYTDLSKTINPLRTKLNLPPSTDLKPICD